jgi:hypothetical protein
MTLEALEIPAANQHKTLFVVLAVIFLLWGAYATIVGIMLIAASHGLEFRAGFTAFTGSDIMLLLNGIASLLAGFGLITHKSWGRLVTIIASCLAIFTLIGAIPAIIILILLFTKGSKHNYAIYCGRPA